ncbi:GNAT family N-acetyltransferase [Croceitalea sp. MTPC9]|uniref:GNAT family N-acetyltransferase n=1 Tax=unclassified Croceitalea TaxID=2632280 RepID=UPI002B3DE9D4|nr:GNAT family N-acetyltransferase [Croceitalea sp. MTPC6]GMN16474.1 GNAT family N-acetyltransferase [Croceitalea sp. MTPC9]
MNIYFENYNIAPIHEKDAWRLCDFMVSNSDRFKDFFPGTLKENLNPTLSRHFVAKKVKEFNEKEEFLFTVKENTNRAIIGLIYVKELKKKEGQGELAYCIGYQYAGKGLMTKIVDKIVRWSFDDANLDTLQIIAHQTNVASKKVAEKNNFTWQKTLPKVHEIPGVGFVDMELYELYSDKKIE